MDVNAKNMKMLSDASDLCMSYMFPNIKLAAHQGKTCVYVKLPNFTDEFINMLRYILTNRKFKAEFHQFSGDCYIYVYITWA